ncbi:MAG: tyrosine-type recombinase/integrase [Deltaproteobacteria bacterium]|nr:tyrosine-type recombinase/integrase [Deltaproteobacteria bacterium]
MAKNKNIELYLAKYSEWMLTRGWSERTQESYKSNVRFFLDYLINETSVQNLNEIDSKILSGFQTFLYHYESRQRRHASSRAGTGETGKRLALSSQHTKLVSVRSFFHFLYETDVLLFNPSAALHLPKKRKSLPKGVMSEKQVEKLLNQPDLSTALGFRDGTILETLYSSGIRNSELRSLAVYDVDLNLLQLAIRKGKNAKDRVVPLGEIAADYIHEYLVSARPKLNRSSAMADASNELLFISKNGLQITKANLIWIIAKYVKEAGLKQNFTPHSLRHSCATHMLRAGADIRYIQEMLGHASVATTQIYTKVEVTDLRAMHRQCHPREKVN